LEPMELDTEPARLGLSSFDCPVSECVADSLLDLEDGLNPKLLVISRGCFFLPFEPKPGAIATLCASSPLSPGAIWV